MIVRAILYIMVELVQSILSILHLPAMPEEVYTVFNQAASFLVSGYAFLDFFVDRGLLEKLINIMLDFYGVKYGYMAIKWGMRQIANIQAVLFGGSG